MTNGQIFRGTVIVLTTIAGAVLLVTSIHMLILLMMAILIASALRPYVVRLTSWGLPYGASILLTYGTVLAFILFMLLLVLPPVFNQFADYLDNEQRLANQLIRAQQWLEQTAGTVTGAPVTLGDPEQLREAVTNFLSRFRATMPNLLTNLGGVFGEGILVFVMGVYWLTSRDKSVDFLASLLARRNREVVIESVNEIETSMGNYIRGVVLVAVFVGFMNAVILSILRVPNAITLGFIIGVTTMLPVVGGFIGGFGATLLAALVSPIDGGKTFLTFVAVQQIETHILTPRVMSRSVGIDPLLVISGIFVGFSLYGVTGAILSVPIMGAINVLLRRLVIEPRQNTVAANQYKKDHGGVLLDTGETPPVPAETVLVKPSA